MHLSFWILIGSILVIWKWPSDHSTPSGDGRLTLFVKSIYKSTYNCTHVYLMYNDVVSYNVMTNVYFDTLLYSITLWNNVTWYSNGVFRNQNDSLHVWTHMYADEYQISLWFICDDFGYSSLTINSHQSNMEVYRYRTWTNASMIHMVLPEFYKCDMRYIGIIVMCISFYMWNLGIVFL